MRTLHRTHFEISSKAFCGTSKAEISPRAAASNSTRSACSIAPVDVDGSALSSMFQAFAAQLRCWVSWGSSMVFFRASTCIPIHASFSEEESK